MSVSFATMAPSGMTRRVMAPVTTPRATRVVVSARLARTHVSPQVTPECSGECRGGCLYVQTATDQILYSSPRRESLFATRALSKELDPLENVVAKVVGEERAPGVVTVGFISLWYAVNVAFNLTNKSIYKFFPFPWTVSTIHVLVGTLYCAVAYLLGAKKASFGRPVNREELTKISGPAAMHAIGHIASNVSFAAVAISLSHTVKTLEPAFNCALSYIITGQTTPFPVILTLVPIIGGVAMASAAELSFNWLGFMSAMASNLTFGFRAVLGKRAISTIQNLDGTAVYAYTTLIALAICLPLGLIVEGSFLLEGVKKAIEQVGARHFYTSLASVGLFYHLYNQFAFNTLERVNAVSHGVCNVVKRIVIIATSVLFFGNVLTTQTKIGTAVALFGTYLYVEAGKKFKSQPPTPPPTKEIPETTTSSAPPPPTPPSEDGGSSPVTTA